MQNNLNVLMVTPRYFPYMGGIETHTYEVSRRLNNNGVNVTLLTTVAHHAMRSLPKEDCVEGIRIIRVQAWPRQWDYYLAPEIYSVIKQGNWDLVHCQGCHTLVPPLAMFAAKEANIPYVLTFHTGGHSSGWRNKIRSVQWQCLRPLLRDAQKLIGVSQFEADYFRDMLNIPASRFTVIRNGATIPELQLGQQQAESPSLIISVGRLEKYKGHHRLIAALPLIRKQCPDAQLLILGSGPYETELRNLAHKLGVTEHVEIRLIPPGDRHAMAKQLAQASLVALLSDYEAHPIAVMEALALQKPVLVADTSGLRELAEQGMAHAISLQSTPLEIAEAALEQMREPLPHLSPLSLPTWDDCTSQIQDIYQSFAKRSEVCVS